MYNIVQNGECVITWISGLPAIFARLVGTLLRWCYLKKKQVLFEDSVKEYPINKIHKTNLKIIWTTTLIDKSTVMFSIWYLLTKCNSLNYNCIMIFKPFCPTCNVTRTEHIGFITTCSYPWFIHLCDHVYNEK